MKDWWIPCLCCGACRFPAIPFPAGAPLPRLLGRMTVGCLLQPPVLGRTWLPVLLLAASAHCHWPSEPAEVVRDWENQLEASMHSVLSDLRETVPAVVGIPDSSAVVGRYFRVSIPTDLIASNGEVVQVRSTIPQGSFLVIFMQDQASHPTNRLGCEGG